MLNTDKRILEIKETIAVLIKQVEQLEIEKIAVEKAVETKPAKLAKGDRVQILTSAKFGRASDIAIVTKVNRVRCTLTILSTGEVVTRNITSVAKL